MTQRSSRSAPAVAPAAARARTGPPRPPATSPPPDGVRAGDTAKPRPKPRRRPAQAAQPVIEQVTTEAVPADTAAPRAPKAPSARTAPKARAASTTTERGPLAGVSPDAWWSALQHAAREVFGDQWEPQLAQMLALLRRRLTGGYDVDEFGFDQEVAEKFMLALMRPIAEKWFRIEVRGVENIPDEGGALIVSNHSGTVPVDGMMTMVAVHDHAGRHLRPLGADLVFRMPFVGELARKSGATLACTEDAERMLGMGELVGVWPEGFKGVGKPFSRALQAPALRPRRLRQCRAAHRCPDHPALGRGRRGDLSAHRQHPGPRPPARGAVRADHTALPVARPARLGAAAVQVAAGVRRADPHRRVRRRRGRRPRCSSST